MLSRQSVLGMPFMAWLMVVATEAWTVPERKVTRESISSCSMIFQDTAHDEEGAAMIRGRRKFLWQSAAMLLPVVVHAEDETVQVSDSNPQPLEDKASTLVPTVEKTSASTEEKAVEILVKEEEELVAELDREESEEEKAVEETEKLIAELEEQIKDEGNDSKPDEQKLQVNKNLIDTLEKEEEIIENETKEIISKIETLEKEAEEFTDSPAAPEYSTTQEFLNKLKERVEEKEDLITRLKRESEKDIDPKTGKFRAMTRQEFKARAPSDFDFVGYLKESVTNTKEFEQDLEAFKGLLESKFGPVVEEVRKAAK